MTVIITTERLILRPLKESDATIFHQLLAEDGVLRYFPKSDPPPLASVQSLIANQAKHWAEHGYGLWGVELRQDGRFMGRSGLQWLPDTQEIEIDFLLGRPFWGKGYGSEAGRAGLKFGFEEVGAKSIVGIVHPENEASIGLLEKLRLKLTRRTEYFGMDVYRYEIQRKDYMGAYLGS